ncbi:MAG: FtsX-like permease family protein, partial [Bacteroidota bacterium]
LESFALASSGNNTSGALVIGTTPEKEDQVTELSSRITQGDYLSTDDKAVLIAEGMSEQLKIGLGDTLVLIGQGFRGVNAAGKYPVKGIVNFGSPELNKQMVYMPLAEAQWLYGAEGRLTSLAFGLKSANKVKSTLQALESQLDTSAYEIMDWEAMLPDLVEARTLDSGGNVVVYFILYLIIAFGIFGTILMMTKERSYEFGVLVSIGMRRMKLARIVWLEIFFLGLLGASLGILLSIPLVAYFNINPMEFTGSYSSTMERFGFEAVFPTLFRWDVFAIQALVIIIMTSILGLFPFYTLNKLKPVQAMRS